MTRFLNQGSVSRDLWDRRSWLCDSAAALTGLALADCLAARTVLAAESADGLAPLNRFPRMMQRFLVGRVRQAEADAARCRAKLNTKADAEDYVRSVREKIAQCFGPFPEKTPLNARTTGTVERDTYKIENVIFESRPGFPVTGNLYLPKGREFPLPGVVGTCGHSTNGKAWEDYQSFAQGLVRQGYVVLLFDPIGQGERLQYPDENLKSRVDLSAGVAVGEHLRAGNQQYLVGEFFGSWRAWDGIRALDYLLTRPEVDNKHLGVTGNSGGGTMTTWLSGVEPRFTMAAPSCFVTTLRRNTENEIPADTEQCPPKVLAMGLDHADFLAALAPKPIIILAQEKDYFDARGAEEAFARLKRLYGLLGAEENIALSIGPNHHGFWQGNREAMYRWFNRATDVSDAQKEPEVVIEEDQTLWCTPRGQVTDMKPRTVFSFTKEKSENLRKTRPSLDGPALVSAVRQTLKLPAAEGTPGYRILRPLGGRKYPKPHCVPYIVETEPDVQVVAYMLCDERHFSRPPGDRKRAVLYVSHHSADAELRNEPLVGELLKAESDAAFFACDVRGTGESRPNTCGRDTFLSTYGSDYFYAAHALMLDRPYVGQKTHDLVRVLDWLASRGYEEIHLAAVGWGGLPATFAALVSDRVVQVTLKNALTSYSAIAESEEYAWPLSALLPGVLETFDLPDCYRALAQRKGLRQIAPRGAKGVG